MTQAGPSAADLFAGDARGLAVHDRVATVLDTFGDVTSRVSKSQVAFRRGKGFAWVWRPGQYVRSDVPAVLSIALPREVVSARFKQVVHPSTRAWMHHLELHDPDQVDPEVQAWLREAWEHADR